jgi:hypothetical protein
MRDRRTAARAAQGPPTQRCHLFAGPGFVDERHVSRIEIRPCVEPGEPHGKDVRALPLCGVRAIFSDAATVQEPPERPDPKRAGGPLTQHR